MEWGVTYLYPERLERVDDEVALGSHGVQQRGSGDELTIDRHQHHRAAATLQVRDQMHQHCTR